MKFIPRPAEQSDVNPSVNAMTIDVEDYFQVSAFNQNISQQQWPNHECRVENNMQRLLQLFADNDIDVIVSEVGQLYAPAGFPALTVPAGYGELGRVRSACGRWVVFGRRAQGSAGRGCLPRGRSLRAASVTCPRADRSFGGESGARNAH